VTSFALTIPNKNQSHFIGTALESLRHQKADYQLAVVDGGSDDGFEQALKPYRDMVDYLRSYPDDGQAAAIGEGLSKIGGDIVGWLNADDYLFPETLAIVAGFFERHPTVDVVYGDAVHVNKDGIFLHYFKTIEPFSLRTLTRTCFICQPTCFVRRKAYESVGGVDPRWHFTMDWDLWCRLALSGAKFNYLPEVLAAVRYYAGTKTLSGDLGRYKEIWRIEKKYGQRLLPISLLGAYRFDLSGKVAKSRIEKAAFSILNNIRGLKRKILLKDYRLSKTIRTIYGFYPYDTLVDDCGTIHLPWYDPRGWSALRLKVDPAIDKYQVKINGHAYQSIKYENGYLVVQLSPLDTPHRIISIRCEETQQWRLLEFGCELDPATNTRKGG
jgi:glycosyltransferase involved in cell wall biosynthesis